MKPLTKAQYEELLLRPVWKPMGTKPVKSKRLVACRGCGGVVVERQDGTFSTSRPPSWARHRAAMPNRHLTASCFDALCALGVFTLDERAAVIAYKKQDAEREDREEALSDLKRIARKYNIRVPKKLQRRPTPIDPKGNGSFIGQEGA